MHVNKKLALGLIACSLALVQVANATSTSTINFKNQRGSTMTLVFHQSKQENSGMLTGKFITAVGNCKTDVGVPVPLIGYYNGNAVSLSVNFPHCKQVVAMTGHITNNQSKLSTLWFDASPVEDPQGNDWHSNIVGSDSYKKIINKIN